VTPIAINTDKALAALRDMNANRYGLYRRVPGPGYSADPAGGGLAHADVDIDSLVVAGYAYHEPSGGQGGSVKISVLGRDVLHGLEGRRRDVVA